MLSFFDGLLLCHQGARNNLPHVPTPYYTSFQLIPAVLPLDCEVFELPQVFVAFQHPGSVGYNSNMQNSHQLMHAPLQGQQAA